MSKILQSHEVRGLPKKDRQGLDVPPILMKVSEVERVTDAVSRTFFVTPKAFEEFAKENNIGHLERGIETREIDEELLKRVEEQEKKRIHNSSFPQETREEIDTLASRFNSDANMRVESEHTSRCCDFSSSSEGILNQIRSVWEEVASVPRIFRRITAGQPFHRDGDAALIAQEGHGMNSGRVVISEEGTHINILVRPPGRTRLPGGKKEDEPRETPEEHRVDLSTGDIVDFRFVRNCENQKEIEPVLRGWEADRLVEMARSVTDETSVGKFGWVSDGEKIRPTAKNWNVRFPPQTREIPSDIDLTSPVAKGKPASGGSASGNVVFLDSDLDSYSRLTEWDINEFVDTVRGISGPYVFVVDGVGCELLAAEIGAGLIAPNCRSLTGREAVTGREFGTPTVIDCEVDDIERGDKAYIHGDGSVHTE